MEKHDLLGRTFAALTVIGPWPSLRGQARWLCRCRCGEERVVYAGNLRRGNSTSCGCEGRLRQAAANSVLKRTHGMVGTPTHTSWQGMLRRCRGADDPKKYAQYGGRGITFDPRWAKFENFLADMGLRPEGKTLDRIDVNGNYTKANCRWATYREQSQNRRDCRFLTFKGETKVVTEWAREFGLSRQVLYRRLDAGWPTELALTAPVWTYQHPRRRKAG